MKDATGMRQDKTATSCIFGSYGKITSEIPFYVQYFLGHGRDRNEERTKLRRDVGPKIVKNGHNNLVSSKIDKASSLYSAVCRKMSVSNISRSVSLI